MSNSKENPTSSPASNESPGDVPVVDTLNGLRGGYFFMDGWIKLHRKIRDNWIWSDPIKLKWWIDILLEVNHTGAKVPIGFEIIECNRGESIRSLQGWATRWGVSKDTARNFLTMLQKDNMIECVNLQRTTRIKVCNYDTYQKELHVKQTPSKRKTNGEQTPSDPNKKNKNKKNDDNEKNILYQPAIDIYCKWIEEKFEMKAKIDGAQGKAMKSILAYLRTFRGGEPSTDEQVLNDLAAIFKHWHKLDNFYQGKTKLTDINSNLQNIIKQLKHGKDKQPNVTDTDLTTIVQGLGLTAGS